MDHLLPGNRRLAYSAAGSGAAVVLIHGSLATSATWRRVAASLDGAGLRLIAPDLPGWGGSDPEPHDCADLLGYEANAIESLAQAQGGAVHLVAHSYGCNVALLVALSSRVPVRSLVLFEPTLVALLRQAGDREAYEEMERFVQAYRRSHAAGSPDAVRGVIDLWGGAGSYDAMPEAARAAIAAWVPRNLRHWQPAFEGNPALERIDALRLPTCLVLSERAHPIARLIARRMAQRIPQSRVVEIPGANHFMVFTHPAETARVIRESVAA